MNSPLLPEKKLKSSRLLSITVLSIYMLISGLSGFLLLGLFLPPYSPFKIVSMIFCLASVICAIMLFFRPVPGRKLTIIYFSCSIIYSCLYFSPLFHEQRIKVQETRYEKKIARYRSKHKNNKIPDEKYYSRDAIEKEKSKPFNFPKMLLAIFLPVAIVFYLCNPSIKEKFNTSTGGA
jgi:hypothetical protein